MDTLLLAPLPRMERMLPLIEPMFTLDWALIGFVALVIFWVGVTFLILGLWARQDRAWSSHKRETYVAPNRQTAL